MRRLALICWVIVMSEAQTLDRTRPPSTPELPVYKLPPVVAHRLGNGLEVLLVRDDRLPLVHLRLGFAAGSKYDPAGLWGLSETTAALLTEGTTHRSARQIAEEVTDLGATLRADSGADTLVLEGSVLAENLTRFLDLLADVARNANFPEEEVQLRKQNRKQELLAQRALADYLAQQKLAQVVFGEHPYAHQEPTPESIDRLDREALAGFRDQRLRPNQAVLVMVGAIPPPEETLRLLEAKLGDWEARPAPPPPATRIPPPRRSLTLVDRPGSVQADLRIGRVAVTRSDPDYFPLLVATTILGGGASSRLFMTIREQKGYAYDAHSALHAFKDAGMAEVVTQIRNEVLPEALRAVLDQMQRIAREPVTEQELTATRNYLSGVFVIRLETRQGLAAQLAATRLLGLPLEYLETYTLRVRAAEAEAVRQAAARYLAPDHAALVVVGDAKKIRPALEKFGELRVEKAP